MIRPLVEVCVTSVESTIAAEQGGADRLELCINLEQGGTSPPPELIHSVRQHVNIPVHVMIRPRAGDFCYSEEEFGIMKAEIQQAKVLGSDGIVFGILCSDRSVDIRRTRELVEVARPLPVTFHRAFDETPDPLSALEDIVSTSASGILTSGQQRSAAQGKNLLRLLVQKAGNRIIILAGAGINHQNARTLVQESGVHEIHVASCVQHRSGQDVSPRRVRELINVLADAPLAEEKTHVR